MRDTQWRTETELKALQNAIHNIPKKKWKKKRRQQICPFHSMMLIQTTADGFHTFVVWKMAQLHSMTNLIPSIFFFIFWLKITYFAVRFHLHLHQKLNVHRMTHCAIYLLSCWEMRNYTNKHIKRENEQEKKARHRKVKTAKNNMRKPINNICLKVDYIFEMVKMYTKHKTLSGTYSNENHQKIYRRHWSLNEECLFSFVFFFSSSFGDDNRRCLANWIAHKIQNQKKKKPEQNGPNSVQHTWKLFTAVSTMPSLSGNWVLTALEYIYNR